MDGSYEMEAGVDVIDANFSVAFQFSTCPRVETACPIMPIRL
jgi:hypothetical protein